MPGPSASFARPITLPVRTEGYLTTWPNQANGNLPVPPCSGRSRRRPGNTGAWPHRHLGLVQPFLLFFRNPHDLSPVFASKASPSIPVTPYPNSLSGQTISTLNVEQRFPSVARAVLCCRVSSPNRPANDNIGVPGSRDITHRREICGPSARPTAQPAGAIRHAGSVSANSHGESARMQRSGTRNVTNSTLKSAELSR
jgi:hypothetical protein